MFEMTIILMAITVLGMMAYELTLNVEEGDWGEKANSFF